VVTAGDLRVVNDGNELWKFADDVYFVVPAHNVDCRIREVTSVEEWHEQTT